MTKLRSEWQSCAQNDKVALRMAKLRSEWQSCAQNGKVALRMAKLRSEWQSCAQNGRAGGLLADIGHFEPAKFFIKIELLFSGLCCREIGQQVAGEWLFLFVAAQVLLGAFDHHAQGYQRVAQLFLERVPDLPGVLLYVWSLALISQVTGNDK